MRRSARRAAIVFEGNWIYGYLQKDFPNVRSSVYPMLRTGAQGNLGFYGLVLDREGCSTNKQAARRLLRFLVGKQGQAVWTKNSVFLPSRSDARPAAGRANFIRQAPYTRPWQFSEGLPAGDRRGGQGDVSGIMNLKRTLAH